MPAGALLLALLAERSLASRPSLADPALIAVDSGPSGSFTLTQYNMLMFSQFAAFPQLMRWPKIASGGKTYGGPEFGDKMTKWTFDRSKRMFSTDAYCVNQVPSRVNTSCFYGAAGKALQHILMFRSVGMKRAPDGTAILVSQAPDAESYTDAWINIYCGITDEGNQSGMAAQVDLETQTFSRINVAKDIADKSGIKAEADKAAFVEEHAQVCRHLREHKREYEAMTPDIRTRQNRVADALLKLPSDALFVNEASRDLCGNEKWPHGVFHDMRWKMQKELAGDPSSAEDELKGYSAFPCWACKIPYVESDKCNELRHYSPYPSVYLTRYADRHLRYEDGEGLLTKDISLKEGFLPRDAYHEHRPESLTGDASNPSRLDIPVDDHVGVWRMIYSESLGMHLMLATAHLYKEPNNTKMEEIRLKEIAYIVGEVELQAKQHCGEGCLIVVGGDFNSEPGNASGLHQDGFHKNTQARTVWDFLVKERGYRSVYQDFVESLDSEGRRHLNHYVTSITPQRKNLIDHVFYKSFGKPTSSGAVKAVVLSPSLADVEPLWKTSLPNANSPSDHLPLTVEFQYWSQP